ncbi:ThuA domain-containing protein [Muricauda sp. 334s03]|uniref:ThuA domain-containing protein n=1 Tax=Flagellimonas yonaguniensis TaxID=3031325 RepID=A0ABT5XU07_9FLAO|nr:ThuA domain-containing protein [[Muricauda] yonaguniensis]MDF0714659.1 ThuA domain-containing protein [[Muricauda] yonaguniensis]
MRFTVLLLVFCFVIGAFAQEEPTSENENVKMPELVMVFTKTEGWRHKSIEKGVQTLRELGRQNGFVALQTESSEDFTAQNLNNYKLVVFLNTTMDVLNNAQQSAFESYIKGGGAFLGVHAAADTEYDWAWYGRLVGGYFDSHPNDPNVRKATIAVMDKSHPSTEHLNDSWARTDEWYNYKKLNPDVTVLLNLDESSYEGGTNGSNHPIAWYHEFDGGRAFYTGGGHTKDSYDEPMFRQHLLGAIEWCLKRE